MTGVERNLYTGHSYLGIGLMFTSNMLLYGPLGITIGAVQMMWIPDLRGRGH